MTGPKDSSKHTRGGRTVCVSVCLCKEKCQESRKPEHVWHFHVLDTPAYLCIPCPLFWVPSLRHLCMREPLSINRSDAGSDLYTLALMTIIGFDLVNKTMWRCRTSGHELLKTERKPHASDIKTWANVAYFDTFTKAVNSTTAKTKLGLPYVILWTEKFILIPLNSISCCHLSCLKR